LRVKLKRIKPLTKEKKNQKNKNKIKKTINYKLVAK
jgi:hypothetical protein